MKTQRVPAARAAAQFADHGRERFSVPSATLNSQFANLYFSRLCELTPAVKEAAAAKWGAAVLDLAMSYRPI